MTRSESINELAAALAKAQGATAAATKDGTNPHHRYKYATLGAIWESCREPLSSNGLAVTQGIKQEAQAVIVETLLMHASGQWVSSSLSIPCKASEAQAIGASITYARKYALAAMVGVAPEDEESALMAKAGKPGMCTDEQAAAIFRTNTEAGQEERVLRAHMSRVYGASEPYLLTTGQADSLLGELRLQLARRNGQGATDHTTPPPPPLTPSAPPSAAPTTLQDALAAEQRADGVNGAAGKLSHGQAMYNMMVARDSYFSLRGIGDPNTEPGRVAQLGAWNAILLKRGLPLTGELPAQAVAELTARFEGLVAELVEQRRLSGITCAAPQGVDPLKRQGEPATAERSKSS